MQKKDRKDRINNGDSDGLLPIKTRHKLSSQLPLFPSNTTAATNTSTILARQQLASKIRRMGRGPRCSKDGLNKGAWMEAEDKLLLDYIKNHGEGKWSNVAKETG